MEDLIKITWRGKYWAVTRELLSDHAAFAEYVRLVILPRMAKAADEVSLPAAS